MSYVLRNGMRLRRGYTTGMCAAGAAKGATLMLFTGRVTQRVKVRTPGGEGLELELECLEQAEGFARAAVRKDAGDDPDVTDGLLICAEARAAAGTGITIAGGPGVGVVTRPGLPVPVGEPAINPVPREVIRREVAEVLPPNRGVEIIIYVPQGEEVAHRTFNERLGIKGGISILGTTGIVEPMSEDAFKESLALQFGVVKATGYQVVVMTPGRKGERTACELGFPPEAVVQVSNFIGAMLQEAVQAGMKGAILLGHHGKLVKVAAGVFNTHSRVADGRMETLAACAACLGAAPETVMEILRANTTETVLGILVRENLLPVYEMVAARASARAESYLGDRFRVGTILLASGRRILAADSGGHDLAAELGVDLAAATHDQTERCRERALDGGSQGEHHLVEGKIYVAGTGPGAGDYIPPITRRLMANAEVVVGGRRALALVRRGTVERKEITADLAELVGFLKARQGRRTLVLVSGDPGFYSVLACLRRHFQPEELVVVPGISSVQLAFARAGLTWEDAVFLSAHGREGVDIAAAASIHRKLAILTDARCPPQVIARRVVEAGLTDRRMVIAADVSYPTERVLDGRPQDFVKVEGLANSVVILSDEQDG